MSAPTVERARADLRGREELFFPPGSQCFGCSRENAAGLHMRFFRDGDGVVSEATIAPQHQRAPGIVHGGIQATLLDEASCATVALTTGDYVVTGTLSVRYRRPCPTGVPLEIRARIVKDEGRYLIVRAELH